MMEKTIKQLADELGVSKQAIRKHIEKLPPTNIRVGNNRTIFINAEGIKTIKGKVSNKKNKITNNQTPVIDSEKELYSILKQTIDNLENQLKEKDIEIKNLMEQNFNLTETIKFQSKSIETAQMLHAGTIQGYLLEEKDSKEIESSKKNWLQKIFEKEKGE